MNKASKAKPANHKPCSHCVCLELIHPQANEVCIAGSFNDWHPSVTPMIHLDDGKWVKELDLPPGRYEYRFVVDGRWIDDPAANETVPNPHGGVNAVLLVRPATTEASESSRKH